MLHKNITRNRTLTPTDRIPGSFFILLKRLTSMFEPNRFYARYDNIKYELKQKHTAMATADITLL